MKKPKYNTSHKQKVVQSSAHKKSLWTAQQVLDEVTGVAYLGIEFDNAIHGRQFAVFDSDLSENPAKLRSALKKAGAAFKGTKAQQIKHIRNMLDRMPEGACMLTRKPGFRDGGFILGRRMFGPSKKHYRWAVTASAHSGLGERSGTLKEWQDRVAIPVQQSTYASFAACVGLGACVQGYFEMKRLENPKLPVLISESSGFNLSGTSGSGKTTASRVGAGLFGAPIMLNWDFTATSLEENASARNDTVLVLDDTETYTAEKPDLASQVRLVNQKIPAGQSKSRSQVAADKPYANLTWRTLLISSSPIPLDDIVEKVGRKRTMGEKVRYIDIAVPPPQLGGIFDQLAAAEGSREAISTKLVGELETALFANYGTAIPAFITYLLAEDRTAAVVRYWQRFRNKAQQVGWDERYVKKFALAYAAGKLAVDADVLPWSKDWTLKAVMACYRNAQRGLARDHDIIAAKVQKLGEMVKDPKRFVPVKGGMSMPIKCTDAIMGVSTVYKHIAVHALRHDRLVVLAGSNAGGTAMIDLLSTEGLLVGGHGGKTATQLPIPMEIGGKTVDKPRFILLDAAKLEAYRARI